MSDMKAKYINDPDKKFAIKINFNTVSRELIFTEMAFLKLVKNKSNLPKLLNLFVHNDITHIVIEYFKFQPFIVTSGFSLVLL
jgi:cell division control protein 7